jgi:cellulose synthase/poly-beta-1,6-N-acetylglucosamine synthase-like glycosyltransferase
VLVADNDAEKHEAYDLCAAMRAGYRWPLEVIVVEHRGIAQARNALVASALANTSSAFVAMLDDDEWADPQWLTELLRVQKETGADVLQGAIRRVFEGKAPGDWAVRCEGVSDVVAPSGPIDDLMGAGNLLIARRALEYLPAPWFDPAFSLSGGEDKDFFVRLKACGAKFAWANEAVAFDLVPESRANLAWVLQRAYSVGSSDMRVFLKHRPPIAARLREYALITAALMVYPALYAAFALSPTGRIRPLRKLYRAAGKIAALCGQTYSEYSVVHGQ